MGFFDYVIPGGKKNPIRGVTRAGKKLWLGSPEERENVSTLRPEQEGNFQNLQDAAGGRGASGAFGESADYYRDLMSNDNADINAFNAPALRQYNEEIVPGLSEQFAGMGAGGLSSSGFRNAQIQGATDLSERLGAMRANLRQRGAEGLQNIGQQSLGNYSQNMVTKQGSQGLIGSVGPALVSAGAAALGGPAAGAAAYPMANQAFNGVGGQQANTGSLGMNNSPYGRQGPQASPFKSPSMQNNGVSQLPGYMQGMR